MPEKVLNLPLSGEEIRNAILDKLGDKLKRDCFLSPNAAYDYFSAHIDITIFLHDVGRDETVKAEVTTAQGELTDGADVKSVVSDLAIEVEPPNTVRVETGQEVPVLTTKNGRPEVKGVRYSRPKAKGK